MGGGHEFCHQSRTTTATTTEPLPRFYIFTFFQTSSPPAGRGVYSHRAVSIFSTLASGFALPDPSCRGTAIMPSAGVVAEEDFMRPTNTVEVSSKNGAHNVKTLLRSVVPVCTGTLSTASPMPSPLPVVASRDSLGDT